MRRCNPRLSNGFIVESPRQIQTLHKQIQLLQHQAILDFAEDQNCMEN